MAAARFIYMNKSRILVVDDDSRVSHLLTVVLSRLGGYEVREENRSFAALETARDFRPHLILLDVNMPGKDGPELSEDIAHDAQLANTPIIFVTSLISETEAGMRNGQRYLSKPVDPAALLAAVRAVCPSNRREAVAA